MPGRFSKSRPNFVESEDGFSVEVLGRTGLRYAERGRSLFVDSEALAVPGVVIYVNSMRAWDSPFENEALTDSDRDRMISNIRDTFASQGETLEVI
jgi:hypothetical protein